MTTVTTIPVEYLFGSIATLIGIIYFDLKRAVHKNSEGGFRRDILLAKICEKLKIRFDP